LRGWPISRILSRGFPLGRSFLCRTRYRGGQAANPDLWAEASLWRSLGKPRPFHARSLFGIAPGGACHTVPVARSVVGSYPTVSPSPWTHRVSLSGLARHHGSLFSVALSLGLPPPGIIRHPCFMESGLSSKPPLRETPRSPSHPREALPNPDPPQGQSNSCTPKHQPRRNSDVSD